MSSGLPSTPPDRRIVPFRLPSAPPAMASDAPRADTPTDAQAVRADAARHYLKFMLPSIPVATFVLSFVYCYLILGIGTLVAPSPLSAALHASVLVDPTLPLVGALLLALVTGLLCMAIYYGYLRISALRSRSSHLPSE